MYTCANCRSEADDDTPIHRIGDYGTPIRFCTKCREDLLVPYCVRCSTRLSTVYWEEGVIRFNDGNTRMICDDCEDELRERTQQQFEMH